MAKSSKKKAQRMDEWFGRIWIAPEVLDVLAQELSAEEAAAAGFPSTREAMHEIARASARDEGGIPTLARWLERHYDHRVFREVRKSGNLSRPVLYQFSAMSPDAPHKIARVQIETWPKKSTDITVLWRE